MVTLRAWRKGRKTRKASAISARAASASFRSIRLGPLGGQARPGGEHRPVEAALGARRHPVGDQARPTRRGRRPRRSGGLAAGVAPPASAGSRPPGSGARSRRPGRDPAVEGGALHQGPTQGGHDGAEPSAPMQLAVAGPGRPGDVLVHQGAAQVVDPGPEHLADALGAHLHPADLDVLDGVAVGDAAHRVHQQRLAERRAPAGPCAGGRWAWPCGRRGGARTR